MAAPSDTDIASAEGSRNLEELQQENAHLRAQMQALQDESERRLLALREDFDREKQKVKQIMQEAAKQYQVSCKEIADLKNQLASASLETTVPVGADSEIEQLRARVADLEAQLQPTEGSALPQELQDYENQLNDYRTQLEEAQEQIVQQEQQVQQQEQELHERIKQTELRASKERADFARQKAEMQRSRDEFLSVLQHAQRELFVLDQLGAIQKLKGDLRGQGSQGRTPAAVAEGLAGRLREFLEKIESSGTAQPPGVNQS